MDFTHVQDLSNAKMGKVYDFKMYVVMSLIAGSSHMTTHFRLVFSNIPILHFLLPVVDSFHPASEPRNSAPHSSSEASLILDCRPLNPVKSSKKCAYQFRIIYKKCYVAQIFLI